MIITFIDKGKIVLDQKFYMPNIFMLNGYYYYYYYFDIHR